jgi:hypothetical protein
MGPASKNEIHVYGGAAETIPCTHGEPFADLPTSFLLAAPTASGKTMIILNLLLRYYKGQFSRIWIFSPSIKLDPQYAPLRKLLERMSDQSKEPTIFEDLDQQVLGKLLEEQRLIVEQCRKRKMTAPQVCVILDDLADRGDILQRRQGGTSGGSWLVTLATRGRHINCTWVISSQCLNLVGTVIRKNVRSMCIWRLRNYKEIEVLCEELSGVYDKQTILELYRYATEDPYSFLFVRLDAKTRDSMFYLRFEKRLLPKDSDGSSQLESDGGPLGGYSGVGEQVREGGPSPGPYPVGSKQAPVAR